MSEIVWFVHVKGGVTQLRMWRKDGTTTGYHCNTMHLTTDEIGYCAENTSDWSDEDNPKSIFSSFITIKIPAIIMINEGDSEE